MVKPKRTGKQLAMKESQNMDRFPPQAKEKTMQEVQLLSSLKHPNIVAHIESFQEKENLYIVMEYVDGGDLAERIQKRGTRSFPEEEILKIFIQIVLVLQDCHSQKVVQLFSILSHKTFSLLDLVL